jgi:hypothetical protein
MTLLKMIVALGLVAIVSACSTRRESEPPRTATEQLLISQAADRAADQLNLNIPPDSKVFVDSSNIEGLDSKYAIAAMRERILKLGANLVADRGNADVVVEIRSGALSMDESNFLIGSPQFDIPIPATASITFPEIALFKRAERKGVAKFAGVGYDAKDGKLLGVSEPQFGFSHERRYVLLLFFAWERRDFIPEDDRLVPLSASDLPPFPGIEEEPPR